MAAPGDNNTAPTECIPKEGKDESKMEGLVTDTNLYSSRIIELASIYTVGAETENSKTNTALEESKPFIHEVKLMGPKGEIVRIKGVFDDGAMINAMDTVVFEKVKHRLAEVKMSDRQLRMANRALVLSGGRWQGNVEI